jgi:hypothetical protein
MSKMTRRISRGVRTAAMFLAMAAPAAAQTPPSSGTPQNPIVVEQVHDGFAFAPDVKVTDINHQTGVLVGGYGGWVIDNKLLLGGGGYGLTNGSGHTGLGYGGFVIGWMERADKPIGFGARALFGFGEGSASASYTTIVYPQPPIPTPFDLRGPIPLPTPQPITYLATYHEHFFITDPEMDVIFRLSPTLRVVAGVGYRLIGGAYAIGHELQGVTGSFSLQVGGTTYTRQ